MSLKVSRRIETADSMMAHKNHLLGTLPSRYLVHELFRQQ